LWGWFIGVFVGIWLLQILLTLIQMKHYRTTVREMSKRSSGYLGVGVHKQRLGIGSVVILVSDVKGIIIDGKILSGVTVFARFKPLYEFNGLTLNETKGMAEDNPFGNTVKLAIEKIDYQMEKVQTN
jgi:glucitol operon activator protein